MSEPNDPSTGAEHPRLEQLKKLSTWLLRFACTLIVLHVALGLAGTLQGGASPADLWSQLIHGDLDTLFLSWHSPVAAAKGLARALPLTAFALGAFAIVALAVVIAMRPAAVVGLSLAAVLLVATLRTTGAHLWQDLTRGSEWLLTLAFFCFGAVIFTTVIRWGYLLQVQGVHLSLWTLSRLTLIGVFFNLAIPGAVGGDLVKMGCVAREAPDRKAEAMLTIFLDRVIGVLGLFVVAAIAVLATLPLILDLGPQYRAVQAGALLVAFGSVLGIVALMLVEFRSKLVQRKWIAGVIKFGDRMLPEAVTDVIRRLIDAVELYRDNRMVIVKATLLAILVHSLLALDLYCIGKALGEERLGLHHYVVTASVANAVASVPVTPGGVGTRDATAAAFFAAFEAKPENKVGSIPVTMSLIIVAWGLIGAVVFVAANGDDTDSPESDEENC